MSTDLMRNQKMNSPDIAEDTSIEQDTNVVKSVGEDNVTVKSLGEGDGAATSLGEDDGAIISVGEDNSAEELVHISNLPGTH